ncbi:protein kinase domain-containing protein [Cysteiniphilum sp. JM-1]|uniref:protein kinase domain-containing protein n=1 Tax=Cysteiniphilum sp. JM-1 TaxID=2610891 RepID=UPI001248C741|nr:protein kinase [Cysteiniphilum sp. JM-1]
MRLFNVSNEEWQAANYLLKNEFNGTKLKHQHTIKQNDNPNGIMQEQKNDKESITYKYTDDQNQSQQIIFKHSFMLESNQIWALPNATEKELANLGKGAFAKVSIRKNQQGDMRLHRTYLQNDMYATESRLQEIKKEQEIAADVGLIYSTITKRYYGSPGKGQGNSIMVMPYDNNPQDLEKKYQQKNKVIPLTTAIASFKVLQKLHSGELSKTGTAYLHRDIKLANIVENNKGEVKLIDYGFAIPIADINPATCTNTLGTPFMIAPEIYNKTEYSESSDIYALAKAFLIHELAIQFPNKYEEMLSPTFVGSLSDKIISINTSLFTILNDLTKDELSSCIYLSNSTLLDVVLKPKMQRPTIEQVLKSLAPQQQTLQQHSMIEKNQLVMDDVRQNEMNKLSPKDFYHNITDIKSPLMNKSPLNSIAEKLSPLLNNQLNTENSASFNITKSNLKQSCIFAEIQSKNNGNDDPQADQYSIIFNLSQKANSSTTNSYELIK